MSRRSAWSVLGALALCVLLSPPLAYESLEKGFEWGGLRPRGLVWFSIRAEEETAWRPHRGGGLVDHAVHELDETRRFYQLAGRHALRRLG